MPEAISHHNITENVVGESKHINRAAPGVCCSPLTECQKHLGY